MYTMADKPLLKDSYIIETETSPEDVARVVEKAFTALKDETPSAAITGMIALIIAMQVPHVVGEELSVAVSDIANYIVLRLMESDMATDPKQVN
jgi:hypothetical protein